MNDIIVLDYNSGEVWIYKEPRLNMSSEEIEDWLDSMGFRVGDINWMSAKQINVNDER